MKFVTVFPLLFVLILDGVLGLDERSAMEKRCPKALPKPFENIDLNWAQSVGDWYFSHGSRLDVYRVASGVKKRPIDEINEDDLYYHSCMKVTWVGEHAAVHGFHGKSARGIFKQTSPGVFEYKLGNYEFGWTGVLTLTDNKTFQFYYKCYEDGEATWVVISTVDDLDKKTENLIHEHARSLGFDEDNFIEMEFEQCEGSNAQREEL